MLNRETGLPIYGVDERPVPASDTPGEKASLTQPFPRKIPAFVRQQFREEDVTNISPETHQEILSQFKQYRSGPMFTPPSLQGSVITPGLLGGGNWSGASFDAETKMLYINANELPYVLTMRKRDSTARSPYPYGVTGYNHFRDKDGYPAIKPPWGTLNAINLESEKLLWKVPLGEYPELTKRGKPQTGTENIGGNIVTAGGLIFTAATKDEKFRAFDEKTGKVVWEYQLPAGGYSSPSTYEVNGKQYVVIAAGGGGKMKTKSGDAFIVFSLN